MKLNTFAVACMDTKKSSPSSKPSHKQIECTAIYLYTLFSFFFLLTFQSLTITNTSTTTTTSFSDHPLTFHPLKDTKISPYKHPNKTWFMSTLSGKAINGMPEHFVFPSDNQHSKNNNKILCISPSNKSYAFTTDHLLENTTVLPGLTFIADSFYDYENPWHGMNAVAGFFAWMKENECKKPSRFLLFKNGEVVKRVGSWVYNLMKVGLGEEVVLEMLEGSSDRDIVCFEKVVMMRRGLGGMSGMMRHGLFEMLRCKAWRYCNGSRSSGNERRGMIKISLVGREGKKRGFKDENGVKYVMKRECDKLDGCSFSFIRFTSNMSFCDQVRIMKNTNILATTHGAQLTNMMFMPKGSSVMEMFPTGWLEAAGVGQFIYQWFASWSEMRHEGAWRDNNGFNCSGTPFINITRSACFAMQKDQQVGVNVTYLASWLTKVIHHHINSTRLVDESMSHKSSMPCSCD